MRLTDLPQPDRRQFKNYSAVRFYSRCEQCGMGVMRASTSMDADERMDEGFGRLLAVECGNPLCDHQDLAYQDKSTKGMANLHTVVLCSLCGGTGCGKCNFEGAKIY